MDLPLFDDLSENQKEIIDLPFDQSHLITGPPGSGKSVMAIYRAQAIQRRNTNAKNTDQSKIIMSFIMYNKTLRLWTEGALSSEGIPDNRTHTYHSWFHKWFKNSYWCNAPVVSPHEKYKYDWEKCMKIAAIASDPPQRTDQLIIDEGQDLPNELWMFLAMATRDTHITVFADENQTITPENSSIDEIVNSTGIESRVALKINYRNTKNIAQFSGYFYNGDGSPPVLQTNSDEDGDKPILFAHGNASETVAWISRLERINRNKQIAVFLPKVDDVKRWRKNIEESNTKNSVQMYHYNMPDTSQNYINFHSPGVKVLTYQSAKGLEFDTVVIPELQSFETNPFGLERFKNNMYVLSSRAKNELYVTYSGKGEPAIINELPLDLMEDRRRP